MYLRAPYAENSIPTLQRFIREYPLGLFITAIPNSPSDHPTIQATHIPWLIDIPEYEAQTNQNPGTDSTTNLGTLRGHLARKNPHAKALIEAVQANTASSPSSPSQEPSPLTSEISIIFTSPSSHYITPKFYTTTKPETGKVVPTWNYAAVQAYGVATIYHSSTSPSTQSFLHQQISDLSMQSETQLMKQTGAEKPWTVEDAPKPYIEIMSKSIIGVEVQITRLEGKWKMSQNVVKEGDRDGVVEGLRSLGTEGAEDVARMVEERGGMKKREKDKKRVE